MFHNKESLFKSGIFHLPSVTHQRYVVNSGTVNIGYDMIQFELEKSTELITPNYINKLTSEE